MKSKQILLLASTAVLAVSCGIHQDYERIERKTEDQYDHIDNNYDFYSRDKITITMMAPTEEGYSNDLISKIEEATNTKIELDDDYHTDTYADKVNAKTSSHSLPDIICRAPSRDNLVAQEMALPLYDLLMQYAPDYRKYLSESDWMKLTDVKTFEVYSLKNIRQPAYGYSFLIREDWLNKVHKSVPTTWDELLDVLDAFKKEIIKSDSTKYAIVADPVDFRYTFGLNSNYYFVSEPDVNTKGYPISGYYSSVVHSKYYKAYLKGMTEIAPYMPIEYETKFKQIETLMSNDQVGCTISWCEFAQNATENLRKSGYTNAKWIGFTPITGPDGFSGVISKAGLVHDFVLNADLAKTPDKAREIVRFLNYFYTDEGIELLNYGVEGQHFDKDAQGNKILRPEYNTFKTGREAGMLNCRLPFYWLDDSYKQMVRGDISEENSIFFQALGIGKYNFVEDCVSMNTQEWEEYSPQLIRSIQTFENRTILGELRDVGSTKWNKAYDELKSSFSEVDKAGREAYLELLEYLN